VQVRQADYSRPATLPAALSGVNRLLLVSGSEVGHLVPQHTNVIEAAKTAGIARIVYTGMLNADHSTSPLAGEHRETERVLREAGVPHTVLRNGYYTEGYTDHLGEYLATGEIIGAAGHGRMSTATRHDYATAAAAALFSDEAGNRTYELGGAAYDVTGLAEIITGVTGTKVTYRDLSADDTPPNSSDPAWTRPPPASSRPWMSQSPAETCRPAARTWRICLAALLPVPLTSSTRLTTWSR
jgi:NAD(P)H dehydrogenase (quinone)